MKTHKGAIFTPTKLEFIEMTKQVIRVNKDNKYTPTPEFEEEFRIFLEKYREWMWSGANHDLQLGWDKEVKEDESNQ